MKRPENSFQLTQPENQHIQAVVLLAVQKLIDAAGDDELISARATKVQRGILALTVMGNVGAHSLGHTLCKEGCDRAGAEQRLDALVEQIRTQFAAGYLVGENNIVPDVLPPL